MKGNLVLLLATLLAALGLSHCVIPQVSLEVLPGVVVSDAALLFSTILGLLLDLAQLWVGGVLGLVLPLS